MKNSVRISYAWNLDVRFSPTCYRKSTHNKRALISVNSWSLRALVITILVAAVDIPVIPVEQAEVTIRPTATARDLQRLFRVIHLSHACPDQINTAISSQNTIKPRTGVRITTISTANIEFRNCPAEVSFLLLVTIPQPITVKSSMKLSKVQLDNKTHM